MSTHSTRNGTFILFSLVVLGVIISQFATPAFAETAGQLYDECPCWVKASSGPKLAVSLRLDNNSLGSDWASSVNWLNLTFTNVTLFNASVDLASLTSDASSGVAIYNESDGTPGLSSGDAVVGTPGSWFKESDTIWRLNFTFTSGELAVPMTASTRDIYVVIRTSGSISNGDQWKVGLGVAQLNATYGNFPSSAFDSSTVTADTVAPQSSVDVISPYWRNADPIAVTATASDSVSGVDNVTLWYRFSADNASWGSWLLYGTDSSAPWSWSFDWPSGQGYYEFYSVAIDKVGNAESSPPSRDAIAGYDAGSPTSYTEALPYYETVSTFTVTGIAGDSLSGVSEVDLYYAKDGGSWTLYDTDDNAPWSWAFETSTAGGDGHYQFYTRARDMADNYEAAPSGNDTSAIVDTVAPDTQYSPSGTLGQNGWYTSDVIVNLSASDGTSGVAFTLYSLDGGSWTTYTAPFTVSGDLAHSLSYFSEDEAGNAEAQRPASVKIDATPPLGTAGAQPSYRNTRTFDITWSASDVTSGVSLIRLYYSTNGGMAWSHFGAGFTSSPIIFTAASDATYRFNIQVYDIAGNSETAPSGAGSIEATTIVDTAPPFTYHNVPAGWKTAPVNVGFIPTGLPVCATYHSTDGQMWYNGTSTLVSGDGIHDVAYYSVDCAGNMEVQKTMQVMIDTVAPWAIPDPQPQYRTVQTFEIGWSAIESGSGIWAVGLYYSTDDGMTWLGDGASRTSSPIVFTAPIQGYYRFNLMGIDNAGNIEAPPVDRGDTEADSVVDWSAPDTSYSISGLKGLNGWYLRVDGVTLTGSDPPSLGSGIESIWYRIDGRDWTAYSGPFTLPSDGAHLVAYYSVDYAGNVESEESLEIKLDTVVPSSSATALQRFTNIRTTILYYSVSDATSGVYCTEVWVKAPSAAWALYWISTSSPTTYVASADGVYHFRTIAVDVTGNREEPSPPSANDTFTWVDTVSPFTSSTSTGTIGSNGWYLSSVTVTLSATDSTSGVAAIWCSIDGGPWNPATGECTVSEDGTHTVAYRSVDRAGNEEPQTVLTFKIDQTAPSGHTNPQPAYRSAHTFDLTWNGSDATSGLDYARLYYSADGGSTWSEFGNGFAFSPTTFTTTMDGSIRFNIRAFDVAGNSEPAPSGAGSIEAGTFVDTIPPQTTHSLSGTMGQNGWYVTGILVTLTADDPSPGSGSATTWYRLDDGIPTWYASPIIINIEGSHSVTYYSYDNAGNIEVLNTATFRIDAGKPISEAYPLPQFVSDRTISLHFNATDAISGVAAVDLWVLPPGAPSWIPRGTFTTSPAYFTASVDGFYQFSIIATDFAGNREEDIPTSAKAQTTLDVVAPDTQNDLSGTLGLNGWYTSDVTINLTATDSSSGTAMTYYSVDGGGWTIFGVSFAVGGDGIHDVMYYSTDVAGNAELFRTVKFGIDATAPVPSHVLSGVQGMNDWFRSYVTVALASADATSGVEEILFGIDGICGTPYSAPFTVSGDGSHTVNYCSRDIAGNQMQGATTMKIDTVAPVTLLEFTGIPAVNGWHASEMTASITAIDLMSGLGSILYSVDGSAWTICTGTFPVGGDGTHIVNYYGVDMAGGVEAQKSSTIKIDSTKPVSAAAPLQSTSGRIFDVFFTAYDNMSGISSVELWYRAEGSAAFIRYGIFTSSPIQFSATSDGSYEFYTIARDVAGNIEDLKLSPEATTTVDARSTPVTTQDFDNAYQSLRSAIDFAMMLLAILVIVAVILAAIGIRTTVKSMRTLARELETVRSPAQQIERTGGEESSGPKEDFEESVEDELGTDETEESQS